MLVRRIAALALSAGVALTLSGIATVPSSDAATDETYSFAVIGDVPYGASMKAAFPGFIDSINADPDTQMVLHLGDIKAQDEECTEASMTDIKTDFDLFADPLVYTPGDNEWADCHGVNRHDPLAALAAVRRIFFPQPGVTLGKPETVTSQDSSGYPENVRFAKQGVRFAALHVVGANDDLDPWKGLGLTTATTEQVAEEQARMTATIANMRAAFAEAKAAGDRAVVLMMQADMFNTDFTSMATQASGFRPLVQAMVDEASQYSGPVYLFNGDTHFFKQDQPLAPGSRWLSFYGVTGSAANVNRLTVDGDARGELDWVKATIHSTGSSVITLQRITPTITPPATSDSTVVPAGSSWRWRFASGAPPVGWNGNGFDASGWAQGSALLGYPSGVSTNIDSFAQATSTRPLAAYFTRSFTVPDVSKVTKLSLSALANDGVVLYVNGTEVGRAFMPAGKPTVNTYATTARTAATAKASPVTVVVPPSLLVSGTNVVSAETHLNYHAAADVGFDLTAVLSSSTTTTPAPPTATFTSSSTGLLATFDARGSSDSDGTIASYAWDFGDGTTGSGAQATHTYGVAGSYPVKLTVRDNGGLTGTLTKQVDVTSAPPTTSDSTVVPGGSSWRWRFASGAPPVGWNGNGFDASGWAQGSALLGYPSGVSTNIDSFAQATSTRPLAAYFTRSFTVPDVSKVTKLSLSALANDGVVLYVNGTEVGRAFMPAGKPTVNTYATTARTAATAKASPVTVVVPPSLLVSGTNVVSAETHLNYHAAADVGFDLSAVLTSGQ